MVKAKKLTRQDIINWATSHDWTLDNFGNLRKTVNGKEYRLKLSKIAVRHEVKVHHTDGSLEWVRLSSGYYKDLVITTEGKLFGMRK